MHLNLNFDQAEITHLVLAKIGNPVRDEPLQTSKQLFEVNAEDQALLTSLFLRSFRSPALTGHRFRHHTSLSKHELNSCVGDIFAAHEKEDADTILARGQEIASRLYEKSSHPNIKSGDLCIAVVQNIVQAGVTEEDDILVSALCLLKSESVTPFLSITTSGGDLELNTEHGINPEKIDKGCLIVNHLPQKGYYCLPFDRAGNESRFWLRDFLSIAPITDSKLLSKKVAELAVQAVTPAEKSHKLEAVTTGGAPAEDSDSDQNDDSPPWEVNNNAREALHYFDEAKNFSLAEFEEQALRTPEAKKRFREEKQRLEEEEGVKIKDGFEISKRDAAKARKLMKTNLKLDTGVEIRLKPVLAQNPEGVVEQGYDQEKGQKFIKIFYNKEI